MRLGYNTNGFAHHHLLDSVRILGDLGYQSVAITPDVHHLNPFMDDAATACDRVRALLERYRMTCVIETGARFLLDPWRKHQPTLISERPDDRQRRWDFLMRCLSLAERLGADLISIWSGTPDADTPPAILWQRLTEGCQRLVEEADRRRLRLAFEPEPGMFIDRMERFAELYQKVADPRLGLTLDLGHLFCQREDPIPEHLETWSKQLLNVHIEDMRRDVHDHLMFGDGEMAFPPLFDALKRIHYQGAVFVELSRHSHNAVNIAQQARQCLLAHGFPADGG